MEYDMNNLPYLPKDYEVFIGIDVDKSSFSFTVGNDFMIKKSNRIPSDPKQLYNYIQKSIGQNKVICAYEAGPTGFHLYDFLNKNKIPCFITSPASIPKASNERVKNNRIDSKRIVEYLMSGNLKPIRVPEEGYRELRHLVRIRENYASNLKTAKQRIKSLLLYANLYSVLKDPEIRWSGKYIKEVREITCSYAERKRLDTLIDDLQYAREKLLSVHRTLRSFCKEYDEINQYMVYLRSIPGIGFITAITLLGYIGNPEHLKNPRELSSFVGLVPTEKSTGDRIHKGPITHMGSKTLRYLLIESAWVAIRHDTGLAQFYYRIKRKNNPIFASKIAITAVARKLTQIIYRVLKDKREFIRH